MSAPDRTTTNGHGRALDGPVTPPQNLEAEQSVLGAVLLSDTALPALIIDERLQPEDFYRESHGIIFKAMLDLHGGGEPVDALTLVEHLKHAGKLDAVGGRATVDLLAGSVPAVGNVRQYARIVRENAMLRRLLRASYEIQAKVHSHEAPPRELVDLAERTILEVAQQDSRKDFRSIEVVLDAETTKLAELSREGKSITGTASGFKDLDTITGGFQPGNLIILAARPSMGKCLAGSAQVYDPTTGERRRIDDIVSDVERGRDAFVASVAPDLRLRTSKVSAGIRSGSQPVFRLATRLGRRLDATANHPLLTLDGWRLLEGLQPGDRIAVPRALPSPKPRLSMPDHEIVLLAALIADGNLTQRTPRFCFGKDSPILGEVVSASEAMGLRLRVTAGGHGTATISAGRGGPANPLTALLRRHGLWGLRSGEKFVPTAIFGLAEEQLVRVLSVLSEFGARRSRRVYVDTIPGGIWSSLVAAKGERSWAQISELTGRPRNHNWHVGTRGVSRARLGELAQVLESHPLQHVAESDLWWDEVVSIEPLGEQQTYDLTVEGDHNFVADDVVVHNSALMANFCENAALEGKKAVALFSLEMSESELAQRFIASQASIKGDDLRKGQVPNSRWPKIMAASARLASSPLYIDDSSDLSVLDVRAKARRLVQQHADGLGLIVIDYLQLMRSAGNVENRVEQIGQISRGLKTLARELEVPVIALSQLNRGVEQRTDKRPVLSDLRESGSIEQDADLVMFIYRDEYYDHESEREGIADVIISKHRNGGLGTVELTFQKEFPRFMSYVAEDRY